MWNPWLSLCYASFTGLLVSSGISAYGQNYTPTPAPIRWGVDDAGGLPYFDKDPRAAEIFNEFGFNLWVMHYLCMYKTSDNIEYIQRMDNWCEQHGVKWLANLEHSNWIASHVDDTGYDWFNRADGRHFFRFPDSLLTELGKCENLLGLMYDEAAHMQNCRNKFANVDQPFIFNPDGYTLNEAADAFNAATKVVAQEHAQYGLKLYTEHVFPVMFHGFAQAGFISGTKILKENWSPAFIAGAMGAARQTGEELWITPDLWGIPGYPGHSVEEYRSALLLAYHMGADCIYTENLSFDNELRGEGSLVYLTEEGYRVTPYGEVAKWFWNEYVPAHPRYYTLRDLRPRVAIIRQEDGCWGQRQSWLPDWLFGNKDWQSDGITEAWLRAWHLLTNGVIPPDSLSWHAASHAGKPYQVFCPLDGVVVYDHHATDKDLAGIEVIFLSGIGISPQTLQTVEDCVAEGATCVALPHLLPERIYQQTGDNGILSEGMGRWVSTTDFLAPHVKPQVAHVLPKGDVMTYRFGDYQVTFRPVDGNMNNIGVTTEKLN